VPPKPRVPRTNLAHLDRLEARFRSASPVFREVVERQRAALGEPWAQAFDDTIARLLVDDDELALAVDGYSRFALDVLRLQARFELTRAYEPRAYEAVSADVYANDAYMRTCYLPGLLLSQYLWPHHYRQGVFFERVFLGEMERAKAKRFYDVGVGTGFYSRLALVGAPEISGIGFDISPSSRVFAESHVAAFGAADRYSVELRDVVRDPPGPTAWLICVEVIEHLEDPVRFLASLRTMLEPGGKAFIGTALNAPNRDHIYLYGSIDDVTSQLQEAGFGVEQAFSAPAIRPERPDQPVAEVAAFIVS
jgi:SAM-dependent methyltransferase